MDKKPTPTPSELFQRALNNMHNPNIQWVQRLPNKENNEACLMTSIHEMDYYLGYSDANWLNTLKILKEVTYAKHPRFENFGDMGLVKFNDNHNTTKEMVVEVLEDALVKSKELENA